MLSKKAWLGLIILLIIIGYLIVSRLMPSWGGTIDVAAGGVFSQIHTAVVSSWIWQQYDIYFALAFGVFATALIMWKGHGYYNKATNWVAQRRIKESPLYTPAPISPTPPKAVSRTQPLPVIVQPTQPEPTPVEEPAPQPPPEQKQE